MSESKEGVFEKVLVWSENKKKESHVVNVAWQARENEREDEEGA